MGFLFLGNCDFNAVSELRSLKARLEELESDLRDRDEEIRNLKTEGNQQKAVNGEDSDIVKVKEFAALLKYILLDVGSHWGRTCVSIPIQFSENVACFPIQN